MNTLKHLIISNVTRNFVKRSCPGSFACGRIKRQLYSPASLKLDLLEDNRSKRQSPNFTVSDFIQKMKTITKPDNNEVVFSSDLLKMLSIVKNEEDVSILLSMLRKYAKQNSGIQFSSYKFGPQVMRLFYLLKKPREALLLAEEEELSKLFSPVSSKIILFDLLYENQMYDDIIRLFKQDPSKHRASPLIILFYAACWKANTAESYKAALEIHQFFQETNQNLPLMAKNYIALLCLEQNNPAAAFEILDNSFRTISLNIKIRALAKAGRFKDLFVLLEKFINAEKDGPKRSVITSDTVNFVTEEMEKANLKGDDKTRWNDIFQKLEEEQLFEIKTLEEKICEYMYRKLIYRKTENEQDFGSELCRGTSELAKLSELCILPNTNLFLIEKYFTEATISKELFSGLASLGPNI